MKLFEGNGSLLLVNDSKLELPGDRHIFDNAVKTVVYNEEIDEVKDAVQYLKLDFEKEVIAQIIKHLHHLEIQSVIVEGGAYTLERFIESGIWDEAMVFEGDQIFNEGIN